MQDQIKSAKRVLDVGSGSGYLVAAISKLLSSDAIIVGIEHIPQLVEKSIQNLNKSFSQQLSSGNIQIIEGDGRLGYPQHAPYDIIHVGAASPEVPKALVE